MRAHTDIFSHKLTLDPIGHRVYHCILKISLYQLKIEANMNKSNDQTFSREISISSAGSISQMSLDRYKATWDLYGVDFNAHVLHKYFSMTINLIPQTNM